MRVRTDLPHRVETIPHFWIPLADGTRLAARMWRPVDVAHPVPAILEYIPYRKGDGTDADDAARHGYFAGHGFASVRVDIRGSGDSDGLLSDEYSAAELADGAEVVAWLAQQPWCNGRVGLTGISWGGFNALQIAALKPRALGAVISVCSTDDRYADDVHYMGGALLARDMLGWAATLLAFNARPPDPAVAGASWRDLWRRRLAASPAFVDRWMKHPTRDAYWRHGSVCEAFAAIECPVLAVGGWADGYTNAVLRLVDGLPNVRRGLIGPWSHAWPHASRPGPSIGFLQESVRWFDAYLRDGLQESVGQSRASPLPHLTVWIERAHASRDAESVGEWRVGETAVRVKRLPIPSQRVACDLRHGEAAEEWCPFGPGDLADDQRADDARATTIDLDVDEPLTLLGRPSLVFRPTDPSRGGHVVVRLCEVDRDGRSMLIAWGVARLGEGRVELGALGRSIPRGHRLRVALARSYWPVIWPALDLENVDLEDIALSLPVWSGAAAPAFEPPEAAPLGAVEVLSRGSSAREIGAGTYRRRFDTGRIGHGNGIVTSSVSVDELTLDPADGRSARARCSRESRMEGDRWEADVRVDGTLACDGDDLVLAISLEARSAGECVVLKRWQFRIARPPE